MQEFIELWDVITARESAVFPVDGKGDNDSCTCLDRAGIATACLGPMPTNNCANQLSTLNCRIFEKILIHNLIPFPTI